jgi:hypothetical protein
MRRKDLQRFDPGQTIAVAAAGAGARLLLAGAARPSLPGLIAVSVSARAIIELNIKHYRGLLKTETDAARRQTIARLLAEEEARLAELVAEDNGRK